MWRPVLLCVLLASGAARAAVVTGHDAGCSAVRSVLLEKGVAESALSESEEASQVCQAGSCCSQPWEQGIRNTVRDEFRRRLVDNTDQVKNLLHQQFIAVQDGILRVIHKTNQSTINSYSQELEDAQTTDDVAMHALPTLFGKFMRYFQSQLSDPELEIAITEFFDDLFVVTYGKGLRMNTTFENCLREKRMEIRPFRDVPFRMKDRLLRTFGLAKFYLQSLNVGLGVLNTTTQFQCSDSCYDALMRLNYCPLCRGLNDVGPCIEFCFNVMRGCMAPLSTLSDSWQTYIVVLRKLATSLQSSTNVGDYLLKVYVNISEAMSLVFTYRPELDSEVQKACGPASDAEEQPTRRRRRRRDLDMYISSGGLSDALAPLPQREPLIDFDTDGESLHKLLRTFNSDVEQHKSLFQTMPESACNDVASDNDQIECWNGTSVGTYSKPVAGLGLDSQSFNPEVEVPNVPYAALREKVNLLDQIQQTSNDKLTSAPSVDNIWAGPEFYDDTGSGYGSGIYDGDDEDGYPPRYEPDYYYGSGSGEPNYEDYDPDPYYGDGDVDDSTTFSPTLDGLGEDGDILIPGETDVVPPGVDTQPAPPADRQPPSSRKPPVTSRPSAETTAKPKAGSAAAAACRALLLAALLTVRL